MTVIESNQVKKGNLLLIGDLLIDKTWHVRATKLSPEGPVPVVQLSSECAIETPGGAGLAASFGVKNFPHIDLAFYTATTIEKHKWLDEKGIFTISTKIEPSKVIYKTRYIDEESRYHLLRVDNDEIAGKSMLDRKQFFTDLESLISLGLNGIALLDYRKGIFDDERLIKQLICIARENNIPVYVDSRAGCLKKFSSSNYLKLNHKEFTQACENIGCLNTKELIESLYLDSLIITKGEEGAEIHIKDQAYSYRTPLDPYPGAPDVTGCGDAFDISFCYYRFIEGLEPVQAMQKAVEMATNYAHMPIEERLC